MRFLLTNDDGIDAPGLAALAQAMSGFGDTVTIAPDQHLSGCSHQSTTHRPLVLKSHGATRYSLNGTPVDCARIGLTHLACETDWVISGINEGANLGADVYPSGTVAAAREATLLGKPAIAVSHYLKRRQPADWSTATVWVTEVLRNLLDRPPARGSFWNVNLPHLEPGSAMPEVVFCELVPHPLPVNFRREGEHYHYEASYHDRLREAGRDVERCLAGNIVVTYLTLIGPGIITT